MFSEAEHAETSFLLAVWYYRLPFPICQHWFSLGTWHNLLPGKESHLPLFIVVLKKKWTPTCLFKRKKKFCHDCFSFLKRMPRFPSLLLLQSSMESECIYNPVAVEFNSPGTQVKLLPVIRRWWCFLWRQLLLAVGFCIFCSQVLVWALPVVGAAVGTSGL